MARYLLDTTVVLDWWRGHAAVTAWMALRVAEGGVLYVSAITVSEALAAISDERRSEHEAHLGAFRYLPTTRSAAARAGALRWEHARQDTPLPLPDLIQAATALDARCLVATSNGRHFTDVATVNPRLGATS